MAGSTTGDPAEGPETGPAKPEKDAATGADGNSCKYQESSGHGLRNAIIVAVVTGIVASAGQYFLLIQRIPEEHAYWLEKQDHLREQKLLDEQIALVKELTQDLSDLQSLCWHNNETMIHYLAHEILTDRYGDDYEEGRRAQLEDVQALAGKLEAKFSEVQAHLMMARILFENFRNAALQEQGHPFVAFIEYTQTPDYVLNQKTAEPVKKELAKQPELEGVAEIEIVIRFAGTFAYEKNAPGHQEFSRLAGNLLNHMKTEIALVQQ